MRGLKVCLWTAGILCLLSSIGLFLPESMWASIVKVFGVELELPTSPVALYMVRLMLGTYAAIGVYLIILGTDPVRYGIMVPFTGLASLLLGAICAITGPLVGLPAKWYLGDAIPCAVLGILIIVFWQRKKV